MMQESQVTLQNIIELGVDGAINQDLTWQRNLTRNDLTLLCFNLAA